MRSGLPVTRKTSYFHTFRSAPPPPLPPPTMVPQSLAALGTTGVPLIAIVNALRSTPSPRHTLTMPGVGARINESLAKISGRQAPVLLIKKITRKHWLGLDKEQNSTHTCPSPLAPSFGSMLMQAPAAGMAV